MTNSIPSLYPRREVLSSLNALDDLREYMDRCDSEQIAYRVTLEDQNHISSITRLASGEVRLEHSSQGFFDRIRKRFFKG